MESPLLSIIIPVFNAEEYIDEALLSCYQQGFDEGELQIICVDDGSSDDSMNKIKAFQEKLGTKCIEIIEQNNSGAAAARNHGMTLIRGKYFCFLDADDGFKPGYLKRICNKMEEYKCAVSQYEMTRSFGDEGGTDHEERLLFTSVGKMTLIGNVWIYMFSSNVFGNLRFDEKMKYAEDTFFAQQAALKNQTCLRIHNEVYIYRDNPNSLINNRDGNVVAECMLKLAENHQQLLRNGQHDGQQDQIIIWRDRAASLYVYWKLRAGNKKEPFTTLKQHGLMPFKKEWKSIIPHAFNKKEVRRVFSSIAVVLSGYKLFWLVFAKTGVLCKYC